MFDDSVARAKHPKHVARASISMAPQTKADATQIAQDTGVSVSRVIEESVRFRLQLLRVLKREQAEIVAFVIQTQDGKEKTVHVMSP
jgi:hypothetical protein